MLFFTDCSSAICPQIMCAEGYVLYLPEGQCCYECKPSTCIKYALKASPFSIRKQSFAFWVHNHTFLISVSTRTATFQNRLSVMCQLHFDRMSNSIECSPGLIVIPEGNVASKMKSHLIMVFTSLLMFFFADKENGVLRQIYI